jgi:DNA polymerase-3 subunit delta
MPLNPVKLAAQLAAAGELEPVYLLAGDEHLLLLEAADALRKRARELDYGEREVLEVEAGFDWNALARAGASLSLFSQRRLIELRLPTGRPGKEGSEAIIAFSAAPPPDTVLLITAMTWSKQHETAWVEAVEKAGAFVPFWPLKPPEQIGFIAARAQRLGVQLTPDAVEALVERTEGHLLAAAQELDKLRLLAEGERIDAMRLDELVADSARFDVFKLADAALAGDIERALRIAAALRAEGEQVPGLVPWLSAQLTQVLRLALAVESGQSADQAMRAAGVWQNRMALYRSALGRGRAAFWQARLVDAAKVEKAGKGRLRHVDPWVALERLIAAIADPRLARALAS